MFQRTAISELTIHEAAAIVLSTNFSSSWNLRLPESFVPDTVGGLVLHSQQTQTCDHGLGRRST